MIWAIIAVFFLFMCGVIGLMWLQDRREKRDIEKAIIESNGERPGLYFVRKVGQDNPVPGTFTSIRNATAEARAYVSKEVKPYEILSANLEVVETIEIGDVIR